MARARNTATINAYARSLLELANEQNQQADAIGQELSDLRELIRSNPTLGAFLADPGISATERTTLLERTFRGRVSPLVMNFLLVLNSRRRAALLPEVIDAYDELLAEQRGVVEVDVTVAHRLSPEEMEMVRSRVSQALGREAVVHQYVNEAIIGGIVLRVGDRLIDASVRYQLDTIRRRLMAVRTR